MDKFYLTKSELKNKKIDVYNSDKKKIVSFGASGYTDYLETNDDIKKHAYIKRHEVNEDWTDLKKAGTWSRYILWNKKTLKESIHDMEQLFKIKIYN